MEALSMSPCNLCPRMCGARRDQGGLGACGVGSELVVARAALHFWEEPPLSGESGSGTVFFSGCPLRCVYCQNAEIAACRAGERVSVERLARICLELQEQGALNVNFVTPTHFAPLIVRAVGIARGEGLSVPIVWNTSGYERASAVDALARTVDVWLADFKYAGARLAQRYSQAPDYAESALEAIGAMARVAGEPRFDEYRGQVRLARGVVVRHLLLPGALQDSKDALQVLWRRLGDSVLYSIMNQYTPVMSAEALARYPELAGRVPVAEYEELLDFADGLGIEDYFWQDGPAAAESFIPAWDGTGVS